MVKEKRKNDKVGSKSVYRKNENDLEMIGTKKEVKESSFINCRLDVAIKKRTNELRQITDTLTQIIAEI